MKDVYEEVAIKLKLPIEVVKLIYTSYYKFIRKTIKEIPLKETMTEDEFNLYRTNFNIPSLGKLYCTYDRIESLRKKRIILNKIRNDKGKKD